MGVRFASSRHLDVVVMAPALTEAGQSQNFKLSPTAHSSHTAPLSVLNGLNNLTVSKLLKNSFLSKIGQTVTKVGETGKFEAPCLNGLTSKLTEDSISLDRLATLAIASELLKVPVGSDKPLELVNIIPGDLKRTSVQGGDTIMNNCALFMEDDDINMGIQTTTHVPRSGNAICNKDKNVANDMDQLLKNFNAVISGDIGQNVDELLQVIKSMESNASEPDSSVFRHLDGSECEEMFPISDGTDLAGGLSSFERVLFNDEDVMDLCGGAQLAENIAAQHKEMLTKERIVESRKIQFELERKCDWLVRRLQKLQTRVMGKHVGEELTGVLEQTHRMIELKVKPVTTTDCVTGDTTGSSATPTSSVLSGKHLKGITSTVMSTMIQRLDLVSQQQGSLRARHSNKHLNVDSNNLQQLGIPVVVPKFDDNTRQELHHVSSQLHTQLKMMESAIDSDATASSSGGESCDEMQSFNNQHQIQQTISKRAAWKWARDRAAIAGRWTWLQAQISDLEYRIRQQNELYKNVRTAKGPVYLGDHPVASTSASAPRNNHSVVVNGFHGVLPGATPSKPRGEPLNGTVPGGGGCTSPPSSRTRPLNRAVFRKRKLLQGAGLHIASRKAARPATMRCRCILRERLDNPCLLCTGRLDPTAGLQTDVMTLPERLSVLDPTLHPVLSFPDEVRESVHYAAKLQSTELQQKMLRTSLKVLKASNMKEGERVLQERRNFKLDPRTKYKTRLKKNILNSTISSKIRRTLAKAGRKPKSYYDANHTMQRLNKNKSKASLGVNYNEHRYSADYTEENGSRGSRHPSPEPGYSMGLCERFAKERRKRENSYDIDNIIIPRSYSSAARVEILNYKEIPTPKWRLVEEESDTDPAKEKDPLAAGNAESDVEDYSDEAIASRHEKCLAEEKKKFSLAIKMPPFLRGRAQRRTDSLAESSGANTPDPMSPANLLDQGRESCSGSPMASPPATPQPFITDTDSNLSQPQCPSMRRRTISQSRLVREKEELMRCTSPDFTPEVAPYEPRTFPLPDELIDKILRSRPEEQVPLPVVIEEPKKLLLPPQLSPTIEEDEELEEESRPLSPGSDSTDSANGEGDDPNDPEWTVQETRDLERERLKTAVKR